MKITTIFNLVDFSKDFKFFLFFVAFNRKPWMQNWNSPFKNLKLQCTKRRFAMTGAVTYFFKNPQLLLEEYLWFLVFSLTTVTNSFLAPKFNCKKRYLRVQNWFKGCIWSRMVERGWIGSSRELIWMIWLKSTIRVLLKCTTYNKGLVYIFPITTLTKNYTQVYIR